MKYWETVEHSLRKINNLCYNNKTGFILTAFPNEPENTILTRFNISDSQAKERVVIATYTDNEMFYIAHFNGDFNNKEPENINQVNVGDDATCNELNVVFDELIEANPSLTKNPFLDLLQKPEDPQIIYYETFKLECIHQMISIIQKEKSCHRIEVESFSKDDHLHFDYKTPTEQKGVSLSNRLSISFDRKNNNLKIKQRFVSFLVGDSREDVIDVIVYDSNYQPTNNPQDDVAIITNRVQDTFIKYRNEINNSDDDKDIITTSFTIKRGIF